MSGLFGSLNNSVKALNAQTRGVETAGRNLANVNNANYARQRVIFGDRGTYLTTYGPASLGLEALGVQQLRDGLLDQQVSREISLRAELTANQDALDRAQAALGQNINRASGDTSVDSGAHGIAECMSDFFNSFQSLSAKPTDVGERQTLLEKAQILADRFQLTDSRLTQAQTDMTSLVKTDVSEVNTILASIATLNSQIARYEITTPGAAVDLRDQRQAKLEELAAKINFETAPSAGSSSQIQIIVKDGGGNNIVLVDKGLSATLTTNAAATAISTTEIVGPNAGNPAILAFSSGSIKGAMDVRDNELTNLKTDLNALARQMVISVNDEYSLHSTTANTFFNAAGLTAGTIAVNNTLNATNLLAGTGASGDNTIALGISRLATKVFATPADSINGTMADYYTKTVSGLGQALSGVSTKLTDQKTIEQLVRGQRDAVSGVSLDEEMADLMKYQRAFQAASRVVTTIDNLLDVIVNQLAR